MIRKLVISPRALLALPAANKMSALMILFSVIETRLTARQLAHPPRKYKFPDWLSPFSIPRIIDLDWTTLNSKVDRTLGGEKAVSELVELNESS